MKTDRIGQTTSQQSASLDPDHLREIEVFRGSVGWLRYLALVARQYHIKGSAEWIACRTGVAARVPYPPSLGNPPSAKRKPGIPAKLTVMWYEAQSRLKDSIDPVLTRCRDQAVDDTPIRIAARELNEPFALPSNYNAIMVAMDRLESRLHQAAKHSQRSDTESLPKLSGNKWKLWHASKRLGEPLTGEELARQAGVTWNSNTRTCLAQLHELGRLDNGKDGYTFVK